MAFYFSGRTGRKTHFHEPMPFPLLLLSLLMIFPIHGTKCIGKCTDLLKHSLASIIGGFKASRTDLFAPMHTLIRSSANNVVIRRKTEWICLSIDKFKQCTDDCDDNRQKMVELANVGHWDTICSVLLANPKTFYDFVTCQRKHLEDVNRRCQPMPQQERVQNISTFCRNMRDYTKCYAETRFKCSRNSTKFFRQITESIGQSFARIQQLSRGHLNIPGDCQTPIEESVQAIVEKASREAEEQQLVNAEQKGGETDYWAEENGGQLEDEQQASIALAKTHNSLSILQISLILFTCFYFQ